MEVITTILEYACGGIARIIEILRGGWGECRVVGHFVRFASAALRLTSLRGQQPFLHRMATANGFEELGKIRSFLC